MCGVFGFMTSNGRGPNIKTLKTLAKVTELRGRHAFGLAWVDRHGGINTYKRPGAASDDLHDLEMVEDAVAVIGHCRWATHGSHERNINNHPHESGSGYVVHNGIFTSHREVAERFDIRTVSECDSEVLGKMIARGRGAIEKRVKFLSRHVDDSIAMLGLWANPVRFMMMKNGRPLHATDMDRGSYFASLIHGLPGDPYSIREGTIAVITGMGDEQDIAREKFARRPRFSETPLFTYTH